MSIKDDVKYVKKELSGDEKVLESAFRLETLYKKYKYLVWALAVAILLFFVSKTAMDIMQQSRLEVANKAFITLQSNPEDKSALETLKSKNSSLYELYTFSTAAKAKDTEALSKLVNSSNEIIADASKYTVASLEKKPVDSKLYHELALLQEAYLAIKAGDTKTAKDKLELIDERSPLQMLTKFLEHSMIKVK